MLHTLQVIYASRLQIAPDLCQYIRYTVESKLALYRHTITSSLYLTFPTHITRPMPGVLIKYVQ